MTERSLTNYISMHHDSMILDLEAHEVHRGAIRQFFKQFDTLVFRIALPPLVICAALYSLTEFVM